MGRGHCATRGMRTRGPRLDKPMHRSATDNSFASRTERQRTTILFSFRGVDTGQCAGAEVSIIEPAGLHMRAANQIVGRAAIVLKLSTGTFHRSKKMEVRNYSIKKYSKCY